jgi:hypothetical protein
MGSLDHPPKIGKTGAQMIKDLLAKESETLGVNSKRLATALQIDRNNPTAAAPDAAYKAIHEIRGYYAGLRDDIAGVHTGSTAAKKEVLDALDDIDRGYKAFAKALKQRSTDDGAQAMKRAAKVAASGAKQLHAGRHDL